MTWEEEARALLERAARLNADATAKWMSHAMTGNEAIYSVLITLEQDIRAFLAKPRDRNTTPGGGQFPDTPGPSPPIKSPEPEIPQDIARDAVEVCRELFEEQTQNWNLARSVVERME